MGRTSIALLVGGLALVSAACSDSPTTVTGQTTVLSVVPAPNAANVDQAQPVVIGFSHAMRMGMEQYAALHEGDVTGPVVPGTWNWSSDRTQLTFIPVAALKPETHYAIHLGGGMRDAAGNMLDYQYCASQLGGQWVTQSMMGGSMMGGGTNMMGTGWQGADGTYGMIFFFTTA